MSLLPLDRPLFTDLETRSPNTPREHYLFFFCEIKELECRWRDTKRWRRRRTTFDGKQLDPSDNRVDDYQSTIDNATSRGEARLGEETAPVSRFNVIIIQSRSRGGSIFADGRKKPEEFLGSIDARFPLSPIRGGGGGLSLIYLEGWSQPVRDIISLFIVDSVPPRLISLSFFAGSRPWAPDRKMRSSWGTRIYLVDVCHGIHLYTEKSFVLYILKRRRRMVESEKCLDKHLPFSETVPKQIFSVDFFSGRG